MIILLILFICLTLALAIAAGAFYWGKYIGRTLKVNEDQAQDILRAAEYIKQLEDSIRQLEYQNEQIAHEANLRRETKPKVDGWETFNARQ